MTEKEWYQKYFGFRVLLWAIGFAGTLTVLYKTNSFYWYAASVCGVILVRFAPLACALDMMDRKYREPGQQHTHR